MSDGFTVHRWIQTVTGTQNTKMPSKSSRIVLTPFLLFTQHTHTHTNTVTNKKRNVREARRWSSRKRVEMFTESLKSMIPHVPREKSGRTSHHLYLDPNSGRWKPILPPPAEVKLWLDGGRSRRGVGKVF